MPAFRLPDDGNCPVFKIPPLQSFSQGDLRPVELTEGNRIRIAFREARKAPLEATFLRIVPHPFHDGIIIGIEVASEDGAVITTLALERIDTITKLSPA